MPTAVPRPDPTVRLPREDLPGTPKTGPTTMAITADSRPVTIAPPHPSGQKTNIRPTPAPSHPTLPPAAGHRGPWRRSHPCPAGPSVASTAPVFVFLPLQLAAVVSQEGSDVVDRVEQPGPLFFVERHREAPEPVDRQRTLRADLQAQRASLAFPQPLVLRSETSEFCLDIIQGVWPVADAYDRRHASAECRAVACWSAVPSADDVILLLRRGRSSASCLSVEDVPIVPGASLPPRKTTAPGERKRPLLSKSLSEAKSPARHVPRRGDPAWALPVPAGAPQIDWVGFVRAHILGGPRIGLVARAEQAVGPTNVRALQGGE